MVYEVDAKDYDLKYAKPALSAWDIKQMAMEIEESNYSQSNLRDSLEKDVDTTIDALLLLTLSKKVSLSDDLGKSAWKSTLDYLNEKGLADTLQITEKSLYNVSVPSGTWKRDWMEIYTSLAGALWKSINFGLPLGWPVIVKARKKAYHKYIANQLYP